MRPHHIRTGLALLLVSGLAGSTRVERLDGPGLVVLEGVTLVDGTGAAPRPDAVVAVRDGRIVAVGPVGDFRYPNDALVLSLRGRYLLPGFVDVHAHARAAWVLRALLARGVTTIRNPASSVAGGVDYRAAVAAGELLGPRILTAGPVIDAPPGYWPGASLAATEDAVRAEVRRQAAAGVDFVKLYVRLPPDLVRAAIDEAHRHKIRAVGDLAATSWTEAARFGIDFLTHAVPRHPSLLPAGARAVYDGDVRERRAHPFYRWFELADLAGAEIDTLVTALVENGVAVDPTLVAIESVLRGRDPKYRQLIDRSGVPRNVLTDWRSAGLDSPWPTDFLARGTAAWPRVLEFVRLLYERGVTLLAGTDTPLPWVVPGESFHRELELLAAAGIPPLEVLTIGTRNGAAAMGLLGDLGTVEEGKRADLVLLTADPVADIRNTRAIEWVMQGGVIRSPSELLGSVR